MRGRLKLRWRDGREKFVSEEWWHKGGGVVVESGYGQMGMIYFAVAPEGILCLALLRLIDSFKRASLTFLLPGESCAVCAYFNQPACFHIFSIVSGMFMVCDYY